jgi:hypothetical protein
MKDWTFGLAMAAAVALYPNFIDAVVYWGGNDRIQAESWLIFFATAGPAAVGPIVFGFRIQHVGANEQFFSIWGMLFALAVSGLVATAYFLSVVGSDHQSGLGAGIAEIVDSSFFPMAYVGWTWLIARGRHNSARPGLAAVTGILIICAGLIAVGTSAKLHQGYNSVVNDLLASAGSRRLAGCAMVGAGASAIALWFLRQLVRSGSATLGVAISFRYGAPALACLAWAASRSGLRGLNSLGWSPCLVTFAGAALLIIAINCAAIRIQNELVQAAAVGCVPLFAVAFEIAGSNLSLVPRHVRIDNLGFWGGAALVGCGIILIRRDSLFKNRVVSRA